MTFPLPVSDEAVDKPVSLSLEVSVIDPYEVIPINDN